MPGPQHGSRLLGQPGARSAKSPARLRLSEAEVTLTDFSAPAKLRTTGDLKLYEKEDVDALARRLMA